MEVVVELMGGAREERDPVPVDVDCCEDTLNKARELIFFCNLFFLFSILSRCF